MGDDGDTLSSNFNKPSPVNEEEKKLNSEDLKNTAEQCEFIHKADNLNELPFESEENEAVPLVDKFETEAVAETASEGGIIGTADIHGEVVVGEASVLETRMRDDAVVVGERQLSERGDLHVRLVAEDDTLESKVKSLLERSAGEEIDAKVGGEPRVAGEEIDAKISGEPSVAARKPGGEMEMPMNSGGKNVSGVEIVVATEGATAVTDKGTVDQQVAPTVGGREKNLSDIGTSQLASAESSDAKGDEVVIADALGSASALAEGENSVSEVKTLQLIREESVTGEGVGKEAFVMEESSAVVKGTEEAECAVGDLEKSASKFVWIGGGEPVEGKDLMAEVLSRTKVDAETDVEVAKITEGGHDNTDSEVSQLVGTEAQLLGPQEKEKDSRSTEEESLVADPKMEDKVSMNLESSNMQFEGAESGIAAKSKENRGLLGQEEIPTVDTIAEMETETEMENSGGSDGESVLKLDDSQVVTQDEDDEEMVAEEGTSLADTEMETETDAGDSSKSVGGKRKRGKLSKIPGNSKITSRARKIMDEDVCFICFDGGDLVLCDRRGCPKAYHPSCVNRDDAFFRSKGRWNCGWHLCSICEKNAHYMCYTCTFSLCKGCIKNAVILCVRGNKGFCETCMRTVKLIENNDLSHKDVQIDFDDKSSWEFLFKDYYTDLKSKLSLSSAEIAEAKNPWKGSDILAGKEYSPEALVGASNGGGSGSENSTENPKASKPKRRKAKKRLRSLVKEKDMGAMAASVGGEGISVSIPGSAEWASKELLEFVMHMKNGDKSVLSQFDVQALLLEYIKKNKLRDPRKKSQIICDSRLQNLFGKPRVGHFEMLKLLESHFLIKEDSRTDDVQGSVVDTEANQLESIENADTPTKEIQNRKRKIRKKGDSRGRQSDRYEYAAIDMHNISLIYLRRKLMEDLLEDIDEFQNKVVGTFVRIRISGNTQKQDLYRLVQVVGTSKAAEPYKVGKRTTDMMLEILNLNKTEVVSIDTISNQDFTEEECKRLRQSIKCGLLNRMFVGDILDKAMEVHAARVNDWLESETLRLIHLRDRASDMGRRKELRECVEKLEILKTPEERLRRLEEVPQIHVDPNMDPNHESDEDDSETDDNRREVFMRSRSSGFSGRGRASMSSGSDFSSKDSWNVGKTSSKNLELEANFSSGKNLLNSIEDAIQIDEVVKENAWNLGRERDTLEVDSLVKLSSSSKADKIGWTNQSMARSESASAVVMVNSSVPILAKDVLSAVGLANSSASLSAKEAETALKINETQKMWHYQDPSGKVQGPFSIVQLRKWSNTGYFPADLKIWRTSEKQDESIFLTDALAGRFQKELPTGDGVISMSSSLQSAHVLSGLSGKTSEISLQLQQAREDHLGEKSNIDQNPGATTLHFGISKGLMAPSVEVPKISAEKWTRTDSMNLPSPTPKHSNTGGNSEAVPLISTTSYPCGIQSATAAFPEQGNLSSVPASVQNSTEQVTRGSEISPAANVESNSIGSGISLQVTSLTTSRNPHGVEKQSHLPQDNSGIPIQPVITQNPRIETHGWGGPPSQKVETNSSVPVPGQPQAYPWGAVTSTIQNPVGCFPDLGASALPQAEFWRPPAQGNQPNIQPPGGPNLAWGTGVVENSSSTPALRPENSNAGWVTMQGTPNVGWVGPVSGATNINWGATVQGLAPGNANSGWAMAPVNMGTTIQGPVPGNVNPGWVAPPGNPGVQGLGPGGANPGWVAPAGNMGSAVVPVPGNGWALPTGNPRAPVQAPPSGNPNHGWCSPAGNQGLWGNERHQSGSDFSGQRDKGPQGGDSGFGGGRPWNGQPSFGDGGSGGPFRHLPKRQTLCPYNINGRCKKGAACDYLHA